MAESGGVIIQKTFHVLDLLQGMAVAVRAVEARGSHQPQISFNVRQLMIQVPASVALLWEPLCCLAAF